MDHYWNTKKSNPVMYCLKNYKIEMARCLINTPGVDHDTVDRDGKYLEDIARSVIDSLKQSMIKYFFFLSGSGT